MLRTATRVARLKNGRPSPSLVPRAPIRRSSGGDKFNEREKALEDHFFREKDAELMRKLRTTDNKAAAPAGTAPSSSFTAHTATEAPAANIPRAAFSAPQTGYVTVHEFLDLKKDLLERIRRLEDELHQLRYKVR
eukprot:TRINITY_DN1258_c0_g1_i1.p1 TRINITY_DN1258_c0_g1~~TRINITY_DN1258_c0_g1_i1.p1  ORF type:complete len:135 (-),score=38.70 TRINITY_DN1258_c0_g1_i1:436-840(-)